jgi:hypothetical protein
MIREATLEDLPRILELGDAFLAEGTYQGKKKSREHAEKFARLIIEGIGKILLWEEDDKRVTGILAFILLPHYFTGEMTAQEIMWFVEPQFRKGCPSFRLLWAAEALAKSLGATTMQFTAPTRNAAALYERFGYKPLEMTFEKVFPCPSAQH